MQHSAGGAIYIGTDYDDVLLSTDASSATYTNASLALLSTNNASDRRRLLTAVDYEQRGGGRSLLESNATDAPTAFVPAPNSTAYFSPSPTADLSTPSPTGDHTEQTTTDRPAGDTACLRRWSTSHTPAAYQRGEWQPSESPSRPRAERDLPRRGGAL